jgi:hypothetical protein
MSKTVLFNIAVVVAGVATYLAGNDLIKDNEQLVVALTSFAGIVNIVLRYFTVKPMEGWLKKAK